MTTWQIVAFRDSIISPVDAAASALWLRPCCETEATEVTEGVKGVLVYSLVVAAAVRPTKFPRDDDAEQLQVIPDNTCNRRAQTHTKTHIYIHT